MRVLASAISGQRHMPVTGQHRYDHIAGLQCGLDGGGLKGFDVLGQGRRRRPVPFQLSGSRL